jgi:hypothetical protein
VKPILFGGTFFMEARGGLALAKIATLVDDLFMPAEEAKPDSELMTRWELSLYQSVMAALDLGFLMTESAGSRHGLARLEKLQSAIRVRDIARQVYSSPTLCESHRVEVRKRVAQLSADLRRLGERSIRSLPPAQSAIAGGIGSAGRIFPQY